MVNCCFECVSNYLKIPNSHFFFDCYFCVSILGAYFPEKTSPQEMMKIFAFANSLVELLSVGLETFNRARYRQFVKRIGQLIK